MIPRKGDQVFCKKDWIPKTDWWFPILTHTDYRMNKDQRTKTLHNIKEIRAEKLKRLNKRFKW